VKAMEEAKYFIEEGIRRFYNENGTLLKEVGYSRFFKIKKKREEKKNDSRKSK
jgi:hypothetical protein